MLRFAWVILILAAMGATTVWLRASQNQTQAAMYRLEGDRLKVRRTLWEQQLQISSLTSPAEARRRGQAWALELLEPGQLPPGENKVFAQGGRRPTGGPVALRSR